jgi:hypothetical protein
MTDFDRAAAEQTLKDAGAKKAKNSAWWTLPFNGEDGTPARANGAKAALAALERGPGAAAPAVAASDPEAEEKTGKGTGEPGTATEVAAGETATLDEDGDGEPAARVGVPTQPEKGGLTPVERAAFDDKGPAAAAAKTRPAGPSHTGADIKAGIGIPTEPDRGGLSDLEKALHGVT